MRKKTGTILPKSSVANPVMRSLVLWHTKVPYCSNYDFGWTNFQLDLYTASSSADAFPFATFCEIGGNTKCCKTKRGFVIKGNCISNDNNENDDDGDRNNNNDNTNNNKNIFL